MGHHGRWHADSTRGTIVETQKDHPILIGVSDIWGNDFAARGVGVPVAVVAQKGSAQDVFAPADLFAVDLIGQAGVKAGANLVIRWELGLPKNFAGLGVQASGAERAEIAVESSRFDDRRRRGPTIEPVNWIRIRHIEQFGAPKDLALGAVYADHFQRDMLRRLHVVVLNHFAHDALLNRRGQPDLRAPHQTSAS